MSNCFALVPAPVDSAPVRSPQAVHSIIAARVTSKSLVEIGTRNGDGMACFSQVASAVTAVERSARYCSALRNRSAALQARARSGFHVLCEDYRKADGLDADFFTWWQEPPHLFNFAVLAQLRDLVDRGRVRSSAEAILIFDDGYRLDRRDWKRLAAHNWTSWNTSVLVDERKLCLRVNNPHLCVRARGRFNIAGIPLSRVPSSAQKTKISRPDAIASRDA